MKKILLPLLIVCSLSQFASAQESSFSFASYTNAPTVKKSYFRLGDKVISLEKHGVDLKQPYVLLSLHNNEFTAARAARQFVYEEGGLFIELKNNNERNIRFHLFDKTFVIDPNRIFTPNGRWTLLQTKKRKEQVIASQVTEFAKFIVGEIPEGKTIISLHNNSEGGYSINDYARRNKLAKDARMVHINRNQDPDNFILTTDKDIFEKLKERNINVVLQSSNARDDGSLSILCAKLRRSYVSIETQIDHLDEQQALLETVVSILK